MKEILFDSRETRNNVKNSNPRSFLSVKDNHEKTINFV